LLVLKYVSTVKSLFSVLFSAYRLILQIGGASEAEVGEKKDRVTDVLNAARAAVKEGIVPGNHIFLEQSICFLILAFQPDYILYAFLKFVACPTGGVVALLYATKELDKISTSHEDEKIGVQIIKNALKVTSCTGYDGASALGYSVFVC
jgi:chaperonin GroEL